MPPAALKLEITESTLIAEPEHTRDVFAQVCSGGVGLHLDDFGTGYSSLSALHRFPVDALKIDRSFVAELGAEDEGGEVIIRSTVAMAHSLGLPVIAEGIEVPAQLRRLRALGCDFGQGHLFSPARERRRHGRAARALEPGGDHRAVHRGLSGGGVAGVAGPSRLESAAWTTPRWHSTSAGSSRASCRTGAPARSSRWPT